MRLPDFALERFFARWEFAAPLLLCASDVEGWAMRDLLALADDETRGMWDRLTLGYTEAPGHPLLRAEFAALYPGLAAEDVLVFSGAEEAIFTFMNVALQPGDRAVAVWPAYQSLHEVARSAGADVSLLPLHHEEGWRLDTDALRDALRPGARVLAVNFPHNPTGALPDGETWDELVAAARESGAWLFSDEVYRGLEPRGTPALPPAACVYERGVSLGVMSKSFALAGLRIGWIATRDRDLLARLAAYKDYLTICSSAPAEVLSIVALRAKEAVLARSREIVAENLPRVDGLFRRREDVLEWVRPAAGSVGFPRFRGDVDVDRLTADLVERAGVLILPGTLFGHAGPHFRLGFGRHTLPDALSRFEQFLQERFPA